jgi:hypothetical protein
MLTGHTVDNEPTTVSRSYDSTGPGSSRIGPLLHNRPDTGNTIYTDTPTPTELQASIAQRTYNRWGHLSYDERNRLAEESAIQRFEIQELYPYDRDILTGLYFPPMPPPPGTPTQVMRARPGTAAREAQDRRQVIMRNFLANGVNPR